MRLIHLAAALAAVATAACALPLRAPSSAAQEPSGTLVVLNKAEATASLIALPEGRVVATLPTGEGPHEVAVSPDGRWAAVSNYGGQSPGGTLTVLDLVRRAVARTVDLGEYRRPHGIAWSADGRRLVVTVEANRAVLVVDAAAWRIERAVPTDQAVSHMVVISGDGRRAYVANIGGGSVTLLDLEAGAAVRTVATGAGAEGIDVSPDGREVWVANRAANTVTVLDARTVEPLATLPSADFPIRVRFTPDGRHVLVSNARSSELRIFDAASRAAVATIPFPIDSARAAGTARAAPTLLGSQFAGSAVPIGVLVAPGGTRAYVATGGTDEIAEVDLESLTIRRYLQAGREPDGLGFSRLGARR